METTTLQFLGELDCRSVSHGLYPSSLKLITVGVGMGFSTGQAGLSRGTDSCGSSSLYRNGTLPFRSKLPFLSNILPT
jgi:hypothetical protein